MQPRRPQTLDPKPHTFPSSRLSQAVSRTLMAHGLSPVWPGQGWGGGAVHGGRGEGGGGDVCARGEGRGEKGGTCVACVEGEEGGVCVCVGGGGRGGGMCVRGGCEGHGRAPMLLHMINQCAYSGVVAHMALYTCTTHTPAQV